MTSIFLATVMGWYLVIISLFFLFRHNYIQSMMGELLTQRALFFVVAIITLILGLLLVVSHNIWVMAWPVVITLFAWFALISAIYRLMFPEQAIQAGRKMADKPIHFVFVGAFFLIIGVFLLYHAYSLKL